MENRELGRRFFFEPQQTLQRHYEMLRAYFVDGHSLQHVADTWGLNYYTVRNLVRCFHDQCRQGNVPPFSWSPPSDDPLPNPCNGHVPKRLRSLTADS